VAARSTDPDRSPGDVVTEEELLDVDAVGNQTLELDSVHVDGVREHDQLRTRVLIGQCAN